MPKYIYICEDCDHTLKIYHEIDTVLKKCPQCESTVGLSRQVNKIFIKKQEEYLSSNKKVGELTEQAIEDNKIILNDLKKELKKNEYNDAPIPD